MSTNLTNIVLDTEFTDLRQNAKLISIALVSECGKEYYAELTDIKNKELSCFAMNEVKPNLFLREFSQQLSLPSLHIQCAAAGIKKSLEIWLEQFSNRDEKNNLVRDINGKIVKSIQIWCDCPVWDWILFLEIFGGKDKIPGHINYLPFDLVTLFQLKTGDFSQSRRGFLDSNILPNGKGMVEHNALYDAKVEMLCLKQLLSIP